MSVKPSQTLRSKSIDSPRHPNRTIPPAVLPITGKSRYADFAQFSPFSREKFRQLSLAGRAPQPERMGIRCTYYDNGELHRWLADPLSYHAKAGDLKKGTATSHAASIPTNAMPPNGTATGEILASEIPSCGASV